ncbi:MAG: FAD-dependent oxidoreductase [Pseudomonadota bacterium]
MTKPFPQPRNTGQVRPRIVFAGAGHAGLIALAALHRTGNLNADVTLVSAGDHAHYSGMVPGWIEGLYAQRDMAIPLAPLAARWRLCLKVAIIEGADDNALHTSQGPVPFDLLVINTGADAARPAPLDAETVIPAKPFSTLIKGLSPRLDTAASFAVIGGGVAGVEVALALATRRPDASVTLVERGPTIAPALPPSARARTARHMRRRGITILRRATVTGVSKGTLHLEGRDVPAEVCLAFTGAAPQAWLAHTPFARHSDGFFSACDSLQSVSHPNVLIAGDAGTRVDDPRPKAGVFSVRTGPLLAKAVRRWSANDPLQTAPLQRNSLILVSTGERSAIGTRNGVVMEGRWVWRWKNHLDRAFVDQFKD